MTPGPKRATLQSNTGMRATSQPLVSQPLASQPLTSQPVQVQVQEGTGTGGNRAEAWLQGPGLHPGHPTSIHDTPCATQQSCASPHRLCPSFSADAISATPQRPGPHMVALPTVRTPLCSSGSISAHQHQHQSLRRQRLSLAAPPPRLYQPPQRLIRTSIGS